MRLIKEVGALVRSAASASTTHSRDAGAPCPAPDGELGLCFWQRRAHGVHASDCHWHSSGPALCAFRGRSMEQPADSQSPGDAGLVHSGSARLGLEFHGRHRPDPHGPGIPVRGLQIPPRADVDRRHFSAAVDARNGLHRPGASIRSGRLLGIGHRSVHFKPHTGAGAMDREPVVGRPHHRGRDALALLRACMSS